MDGMGEWEGMWTYADAWTVGAQDTDLETVADGVQVLGFLLERSRLVVLLGDRWVGLGVDLLWLQGFRHVVS